MILTEWKGHHLSAVPNSVKSSLHVNDQVILICKRLVSTQLTQLNIPIRPRQSQQPSLARLAVCTLSLRLPNLVNLHRPRTSSRRLTAAAGPPKSQSHTQPGDRQTPRCCHLPLLVKIASPKAFQLPCQGYNPTQSPVFGPHLLIPSSRPNGNAGQQASQPASQPTWRASLRNTPRWPYT